MITQNCLLLPQVALKCQRNRGWSDFQLVDHSVIRALLDLRRLADKKVLVKIYDCSLTALIIIGKMLGKSRKYDINYHFR